MSDLRILFIDTETTGTPKNYNAYPTDILNWPRLVSFAFILSDNKGNVLEKGSFIIKPCQYIIPVEATKIHGISTSEAISNGIDIEDALLKIRQLGLSCDIIVGHNVLFDINVVDAEFFRLSPECPLSTKPYICTMKGSVDFCNLPNKKFPKLEELYKILFGKYFNGAHDAMIDIEATYDCFWILVNAQILSLRNPTDISRLFGKASKSWRGIIMNADLSNEQNIIIAANYIYSVNYYMNPDFYVINSCNVLSHGLIVDYTQDLEYPIKKEFIDHTPEVKKKKQSEFIEKCILFPYNKIGENSIKAYVKKYGEAIENKNNCNVKLVCPNLGVKFLDFDSDLNKFAFIAYMFKHINLLKTPTETKKKILKHIQENIQQENRMRYQRKIDN